MSEKKKLVPKRRFKEFENADPWEQRKIGEITESYSGGTPSITRKEYYNGTIPFIRSAEINKRKTELFLSENGINNSSAKLVRVGDILYALYGATSGEVGISQINGAINQAVLAIIPYKSYDTQFLMQWLRKRKQEIIKKYLQGGQGNLSGSLVKNLIIKLPNSDEQIKIGSILKIIDNLITLHQRKLEKLKNLKSAYLSEMFPAEGERKPKRRFAGFTDDWEQQKVESLFKITRGYVLAADKTSLRKTKTMKYPVYSSQTLNNGLLGYYNEFLFEKAITWTTDGANAGTVCYRNEKFYSTNVNGVLISKVGYSCKAVAESLNRVAWKHVTKVGNPKLMNNTMSNIILMVPIDFEELDKISKFFTYTDNLITLHQRKLEKLQNTKKAYLNEMFI